MLVGLQKQGKTTLLSRLTEMNEVEHLASTYSSRMSGDPTASSYGQRPTRNASGKYMLLPIFMFWMDMLHVEMNLMYTHTHTHTHTHTRMHTHINTCCCVVALYA